ncbi:hypothetical protein EDB92DRAFT_1152033 [Lactarius akahatsu]|uniref:Uncharacterized protein n=1 Tax=Lactarius akahatsu TaxID=416441 RepID=A0AAD4LAZ2_9AGAM|nr:hypothetical protein EDB92DRAFT_1152033 [Lactarius akahatsu]
MEQAKVVQYRRNVSTSLILSAGSLRYPMPTRAKNCFTTRKGWQEAETDRPIRMRAAIVGPRFRLRDNNLVSDAAPRRGCLSKGTCCGDPRTSRSRDDPDQRPRSPLGRSNRECLSAAAGRTCAAAPQMDSPPEPSRSSSSPPSSFRPATLNAHPSTPVWCAVRVRRDHGSHTTCGPPHLDGPYLVMN